jgi:L-fucose mutarotase
MLKGKLIHPQILEALGRAGHSSQILIADGNYPCATRLGPRASLVHLNLAPGVVTCAQVLEALVTAVPIEAACVMQYPTQGTNALAAEPPVWAEFRQALADAGASVELQPLERFGFYEAAGGPDVVLTIATGEQATYANLLLTIGVIRPGGQR